MLIVDISLSHVWNYVKQTAFSSIFLKHSVTVPQIGANSLLEM